MAPPVPQRPTRDSHGCDPRRRARQWCHRHEERPNHEPPATAWNGFVTTYAVTFGGRRRLIWTTAEELEELRPVADTEQHHMRSGMDDQRFMKDDLPPARESASALPDRSSAFFSALVTEQFVQQSVRGVTVSESSSRASLYMFTLSSALIAYGFLADTDVAAAYLGVVLPIVFLLGTFTWERLVQTALKDVIAVGVIQRIRRYYATLLPGAEYFFPQPTDRTAVHELLDIGT